MAIVTCLLWGGYLLSAIAVVGSRAARVSGVPSQVDRTLATIKLRSRSCFAGGAESRSAQCRSARIPASRMSTNRNAKLLQDIRSSLEPLALFRCCCWSLAISG